MLSIFYFIKRGLLEKTLDLKENQGILKRGFYVKNFFGFFEFMFISTSIYSVMGLFYISFYDYFFGESILFGTKTSDPIVLAFLSIFILIVLLYYLVVFFFLYVFFDKIFYIDGGIYVFGKVYTSTSEIRYFGKYFDFIERMIYGRGLPEQVQTKYGPITGKRARYQTIVVILLFLFIEFYLFHISILIYVLMLTIIFTIRQLIEHFHPLYNFGNLGEKIQKLTPIIEVKSKEIQKNFQNDMNFQVLSEGFDSLSSTFSQIVTLTIKLEYVEKKANKGNLFDSTKYINSLRSDIVEPLKQLKSFLEKQREELLHSQKELQRIKVQVGADPSLRSGGQEQAELSSKRSEPLLGELTENIEKLDAMIQKISK